MTLTGKKGSDMANVDEQASTSSAIDIDELMRRIREGGQRRREIEPEALPDRKSDDIDSAQLSQALRAQAEFNLSLVKVLERTHDESAARLQNLASLNERLEQKCANLATQLRSVEEKFVLQDQISGLVQRDMDEMRMRVLRAERALRKPLSPDQSWAASTEILPAPPEAVGDPHFDRFMFEQRFRTSANVVQQRQESYLQLFHGCQNVVDIACGRGEFLEMLVADGVPAKGVDRCRDMVDFCLDKGLSVVLANPLDYLHSLEDASLDGLFAAQVIEHLTTDQILKLIALASKKLKKGGVMVLETLNWQCLQAMQSFYRDPSHVRPVPAELLVFMIEQSSFRLKNVRFSSPVLGTGVAPLLDLIVPSSPESSAYHDYAVIAVRS